MIYLKKFKFSFPSKYFCLSIKLKLNSPTISEILKNYPDSEISKEYQSIFIKNLDVKINITKTMLEFFGTNPFLQNLFRSDKENLEFFNNNENNKNQEIKQLGQSSGDPILDKLIQTYKNEDLEKNNENKLKTIYSEGESSFYSINEEETYLQIPKLFFNNKQNHTCTQKNSLNCQQKNEESDLKNSVVIGKSSTEKVDKKTNNIEEEQKNLALSMKKEDLLNNSSIKRSFAMNRRGDEFLKMPSLNILSYDSPTIKGTEECKLKLNKLNALEEKQISLHVEENDFALRQSKIQKKNIDSNIENNFKMLVNYIKEDVSTWDKVSKSKFLEVHRRKVPIKKLYIK